MSNDSTTRFSNRVDDYVKYRPGYPSEIIAYLQQNFDLQPGKIIADIGAGTGISTAMLLAAGYTVYAVEPNSPMREKSIDLLGAHEKFTAVDGTAENTNLPPASVHAIFCAQAFHWFNRQKARDEFVRILQPNGLVVLVWNERETQSAFEKEYDALITQHAIDYVQVDHRNIGAAQVQEFFAPASAAATAYPNHQVFNFEGLTGRLLSSSYIPQANDPRYVPMINALEALFNKYQENGFITIHYTTHVYAGELKKI